MKLFFDTNIFLDLLLNRPDFADDAAEILAGCASGAFIGGFSTLSACNIAYFLRKELGRDVAEAELAKVCGYVELIDTTAASVRNNLQRPHVDFEDSVQWFNCLAPSSGVPT